MLASWSLGRNVLSTSSPLYFLAGYGPSLAGLILAGRLEGRGGPLRLLSRALPSRAGFPWYLAVLAGYPALALMAARAMPSGPPRGGHPPWDHLLGLLLPALVADTGPLGEEFGWRGFALPRLLRRRTPLAAALILGLAWGTWHLPTFFIPSMPQHRLWFPLFLLNTVATSVLMTWMFLRAGGDLLLMILAHWMANTSALLGIPFEARAAVDVILATLVVASGGLGGGAGPADVAPMPGEEPIP